MRLTLHRRLLRQRRCAHGWDVESIGLTLAVGVLLDAFVVRLTLIPAIMSVLGSTM